MSCLPSGRCSIRLVIIAPEAFPMGALQSKTAQAVSPFGVAHAPVIFCDVPIILVDGYA